MVADTVTTDSNGRGTGGKFGQGNQFARGHKHRLHLVMLRSAFTKALTPDDIQAVAGKLKEPASAGDVSAIRIFLGRPLGKVPSDEDLVHVDEELDRESSIQLFMEEYRPLNADLSPEFLRQKAEFRLRIAGMTDNQKGFMVKKAPGTHGSE